jgi:uncharacterized protein (TIGR04255 family)
MKKSKKTIKNSSKHPSFKNPTIEEALCEIHFTLSPENPWKASFIGEFFKKIQKDYPEMEPGFEVGLQYELSPQKIGQSWLAPRQRVRFKHKERPLLIQLAQNTFTLNVLTPYPGWEIMKVDVLDAWENAKEIFKPTAINRIGLRYINKIKKGKRDEKLGEWLKVGDYISAGIVKNKGRFLSRIESYIDDNNRIIVTVAEEKQVSKNGEYNILFDIDRILQKDIQIDKDILSKEMENLHDDIWEIFDASKTEKLTHHLNGGVK